MAARRVALLVGALLLLGCRDRCSDSGKPAADGSLAIEIETRVEKQERDIDNRDAAAEWRRHHPQSKEPSNCGGTGVYRNGPELQVFFVSFHGCGETPSPQVRIRGGLIRIETPLTGLRRPECGEACTLFETTVRNLPSGRYRVVGPRPQDDTMVTIP